jgi:hypothetical protein
VKQIFKENITAVTPGKESLSLAFCDSSVNARVKASAAMPSSPQIRNRSAFAGHVHGLAPRIR